LPSNTAALSCSAFANGGVGMQSQASARGAASHGAASKPTRIHGARDAWDFTVAEDNTAGSRQAPAAAADRLAALSAIAISGRPGTSDAPAVRQAVITDGAPVARRGTIACMSTASALVRVVLDCSDAAERPQLLAASGIDPHSVDDRDARIATPAYLELFAAAAARSRDPSFGFAVARALDAAAFGLLGFVLASSPTLRDAIGRLTRYSRLLCDELRIAVDDEGAEVAIVYGMEASPRVPALFEMAFTHLVMTARRGTRGAFAPLRVRFRHRAGPRELADRLGCPVEFGAVSDSVHCDRATLDLPLRGANPTLLGILEDHTRHVLAGLPRPDDLLHTTRLAIRALLPQGEPSLALVARRLGLGARTLQRRLQDKQCTFRAMVDDVRRECALEQLARSDVSVAEVAFSLGFADASAFHHAFRRWTGSSPRGRPDALSR
jgi:AraC-like DNA-binding protein